MLIKTRWFALGKKHVRFGNLLFITAKPSPMNDEQSRALYVIWKDFRTTLARIPLGGKRST